MMMQPNVIFFQPRPRQPGFRRPRVLVQAARIGLRGWNRDRDLRRLLRCEELPMTGAALPRLRTEEERLNHARCERQADYDLQRHVLLLIAIMAETAAAAPRPVIFPGTAIQARP
ncbi:DUF6477 family protein [Paracoccus laeviglucosivorans]|uniref:Uncharacterized protein n=1 Tax=Paracoccus laeviglucosivorans TaxID=1197861 RepID=A0A521BWC3_9RHOB|nr:DUF6477 family protein [Paracoccus laeviglucosivorans]SMO51479.1 hypothetical protein SAMN06265221_103179 [Paracoccus laeviglucosivorans]